MLIIEVRRLRPSAATEESEVIRERNSAQFTCEMIAASGNMTNSAPIPATRNTHRGMPCWIDRSLKDRTRGGVRAEMLARGLLMVRRTRQH
ncbi:hypothetical protein GCM10009582_01660 [Arthrobacter flavus]